MTNDIFSEFMDIIRKLRSQDGCPWDKEQTHDSLKTCLIEECYETIEAIDNHDMDNLCEELGDILLQIAMHSVIAEEEGAFTIEDVIKRIGEKMVRRHPHVFGDVNVSNSEEVLEKWEEIKKKEKKNYNPIEDVLSIPKAFPSIIRAEKVLKKVAKYSMEKEDIETAVKRVEQMLENLLIFVNNGEDNRFHEKYGNLLMSIVNLSLVLHINAENSLTKATNEFINRLVDIFTLAEGRGYELYEVSPKESNLLWGDKQ